MGVLRRGRGQRVVVESVAVDDAELASSPREGEERREPHKRGAEDEDAGARWRAMPRRH